MHFDHQSISILSDALKRLESGFPHLPDSDAGVDFEQIRNVLLSVADRLKDNYPYFHPSYAGQMLKPPHPVARIAYSLAMWINPNNHALDGGRASSAMEKEAVAEIAGMVGWKKHLGHLTGGGTMANLEALWVAGRLHPGKAILGSELAHYTHKRISDVLGLRFEEVSADARGRMNVEQLRRRLDQGNVGTVVATIGTTGTGSLDPLPELLELRSTYGFRLHADAAYGGYFILLNDLPSATRAALDRISEVDSIVIDPHKHGLQPYGCGCILFKNPDVGSLYRHDSPYTYFTSADLHLGEISLECSRAGASAVALWATQQLLPLDRNGEFASMLAKSRQAAIQLHQRLGADARFKTVMEPELDIVMWAPAAATASAISARSRRLFEEAARRNLHLALSQYPAHLLRHTWPDVDFDAKTVTCLRSCLMKPEHLDWMERLWEDLSQAMDAVG